MNFRAFASRHGLDHIYKMSREDAPNYMQDALIGNGFENVEPDGIGLYEAAHRELPDALPGSIELARIEELSDEEKDYYFGKFSHFARIRYMIDTETGNSYVAEFAYSLEYGWGIV